MVISCYYTYLFLIVVVVFYSFFGSIIVRNRCKLLCLFLRVFLYENNPNKKRLITSSLCTLLFLLFDSTHVKCQPYMYHVEWMGGNEPYLQCGPDCTDISRENLAVLPKRLPPLWLPPPCNVRGACLGEY